VAKAAYDSVIKKVLTATAEDIISKKNPHLICPIIRSIDTVRRRAIDGGVGSSYRCGSIFRPLMML
jgi:hypothetical protein